MYNSDEIQLAKSFRNVAFLFETIMKEALYGTPLTPNTLDILSHLSDRGPSTHKQLFQSYVGTNCSYTLKTLIEKGFIVSEASTLDKRSANISITPQGQSVHNASMAKVRDYFERRGVADLFTGIKVAELYTVEQKLEQRVLDF